jgi:hypothetical protein
LTGHRELDRADLAPPGRGVVPRLQVAAQLLALLLLLAGPATANVGVPILTILWPAAWLSLVVIIPLEALVAMRVFGAELLWSLKLAVRANLVSTALGLPALWGVPTLAGFQDMVFGALPRILGVPLSDRHYLGFALAAAVGLCIPCYLMSVGCEYFVARRAVKAPMRGRVRRWAWTANALSYALFFILAASYFEYAVPHWYGKVWQVICVQNLKGIGAGLNRYQLEHDGRMPQAAGFSALAQSIRPHLIQATEAPTPNERLLRCPATGQGYQFNTTVSGVRLSSIHRPGETPVIRDSLPHAYDGRYCVLFANGAARPRSAAELEATKGAFK